MKLLIIGYSAPGQIGNYFESAAKALGIPYMLMDLGLAETKNRLVQKAFWHLRDKRPAHLVRFAKDVLEICRQERPAVVLTTGGRAPLERAHVEAIRNCGGRVINYSTDDPWNPTLYAGWFVSALPAYNAIFTPRRANIADFHSCGAREIHFLPFGYDPQVHRPWPQDKPAGAACDLLFVGGCDDERLPMISALADAGLKLALFGRYWNRHAKTRIFARGVASQDVIRAASASASIKLCLVRRANRDGHVMRSFEARAIGGCILAEDTPDHRDIFGPDGELARFFNTIPEMVHHAEALIADEKLRANMWLRLRDRCASCKDTYGDRLATMMHYAEFG